MHKVLCMGMNKSVTLVDVSPLVLKNNNNNKIHLKIKKKG